MKADENEITINGTVYVPKADVSTAEKYDGMEYKIVRTRSAGVFAGYVKARNGTETEMVNVRRLWYWKGAASLSQLAVDGVSCPNDCKFPCDVSRITITETIEILDVTEKAKLSITGVKIWTV